MQACVPSLFFVSLDSATILMPCHLQSYDDDDTSSPLLLLLLLFYTTCIILLQNSKSKGNNDCKYIIYSYSNKI
jgi:hypothetical protein